MDTLIDGPASSSSTPAPRGDTRVDSRVLETVPEPEAPVLALRLEDGRELRIDRTLQLGSAAANDVVLDDPFVSGAHCALVRQAGRTLVKDLGSRNGCWLGASRVRVAELQAGARLTVGRTTLHLVAAGANGGGDGGLLGKSAAMARLRHELACAAPTQLPVLLLGESGTGKELAARALHQGSGRRGKLVAVNCGALSPEVVESELFGHERGAFTGAASRRPGLFVEADGGTLFFDEIGELPLLLQPKLLRALETGRVRAVGSTGERRVDVRAIAATHRDLPAAVEAHRFRLDLYHRLSTIEVRLPPLRERPEDVLVLAHYFLEQAGVGAPGRGFSAASLAALSRHGWPGNVRELRNAVTRAAHLGGQTIEPADLFPVRHRAAALPPAVDAAVLPPAPAPSAWGPSLPTWQPARAASASSPAARLEGLRLDELQRQAIEQALLHTGGNVRAAARALGIPPSTLHDRLRRGRGPATRG